VSRTVKSVRHKRATSFGTQHTQYANNSVLISSRFLYMYAQLPTAVPTPDMDVFLLRTDVVREEARVGGEGSSRGYLIG
jgi:hypothetical protein